MKKKLSEEFSIYEGDCTAESVADFIIDKHKKGRVTEIVDDFCVSDILKVNEILGLRGYDVSNVPHSLERLQKAYDDNGDTYDVSHVFDFDTKLDFIQYRIINVNALKDIVVLSFGLVLEYESGYKVNCSWVCSSRVLVIDHPSINI